MKTIFIVEDNMMILEHARRVLESQYVLKAFTNAEEMHKTLTKEVPDLFLLSVEAPALDGFKTIIELKANERTSKIPVMFMSATRNADIEAGGMEYGAVDFVTKPFSASVILNRIAHHLHIEALLKKRTERLAKLQDGILEVVVDMVESRDKIMGGHVERTSQYIRVLLESMVEHGLYAKDMAGWDIDMVVSATRLHDIGKIAVSEAILNKPDRLTNEEFDEMKKHAAEGEHIVEKIMEKTGEEAFLKHAMLFAGCHHEKWNGTGYPRGLKQEEIPLQGRMMAIADVYDALVSVRPYKIPMSHAEAVQVILDDAGKHFDPNITDIFGLAAQRFEEISLRAK